MQRKNILSSARYCNDMWKLVPSDADAAFIVVSRSCVGASKRTDYSGLKLQFIAYVAERAACTHCHLNQYNALYDVAFQSKRTDDIIENVRWKTIHDPDKKDNTTVD
jgi:hypothetical protein